MEQLYSIAAGARHRRRKPLPGSPASAGAWFDQDTTRGAARPVDSSFDGHAVG